MAGGYLDGEDHTFDRPKHIAPNNFTPSKETLARMKVMQSPELLAILKRMEDGWHIQCYSMVSRLARETPYGNKFCGRVSTRNINTLERAGLIAPVEYDDYIEYRLTYTGTFEELVRK